MHPLGDLLAVALYLQLRCGNGALILCDLGAGNRILLLIGVGLELFLDQFLRDAPGLCGQAPDLIGPRPGRTRHGDRGADGEECNDDKEPIGAPRRSRARSDLRFRPGAVHDPSNLAAFPDAPPGAIRGICSWCVAHR